MSPDDDSVASIKAPGRVALKGFELADDAVHMLEWLGRGPDFRSFVVRDVETELYAQDAGAQLLSLECMSRPEYETRALPREDDPSLATVTGFSVIFALRARVTGSDGTTWRLEMKHSYVASSLDTPPERRVQMQFQVVAQAAD
jgi:hypothetical protein